MQILFTMFALFNLLFFNKIYTIAAQINMTVYQNLPPLYSFDNYDNCLLPKNSSYCIVFAEIEKNENSNTWLNIKNLKKDLLRHFNHENLFFGVCVEQCKNLFNNMSPVDKSEYIKNKTLKNEITEFYQRVHRRHDDHQNRLLYQNVLDACLNYRFQQQFNLSISTSIEYCEEAQKVNKLDLLDILFCIVLATIVSLNILSSLYDYRLKVEHFCCENNDFYKNKQIGYNHLLTSFSVCRNYYRITGFSSKMVKSNETDLNFTYAFRIFTLFIVILGHCIMMLMSIQIQNPEFIEKYYYKTEAMLFQNGSAIIQIFFVLAGFLLKLKFTENKLITKESSFQTGLLVYIQGFLNRYLRLLPSLVMVILFNATLLVRLGDGPFWRHITESEYTFCRENWWENVLMVNNFMVKESCAQHTWFLAADMQLYELFLFTVILTSKFQMLKMPIYTFFGVLAFLVPGCLTYFYKLDAIHFLKPESYRYLYFKDVETFYLTYPQSYCNIGGYLIGFLCAEIYLQIKQSQKHCFSKYRGVMKFEVALLALVLLYSIALLLSGILVIHADIKKPSMLLSLYAGMYRNMWSIIGGFFLLLMLIKMGWIAYEIACLSIFRVMGKISYQSYLWHVTIIKTLVGYYRQPVYINEFYAVCQIILTFVLTNFVAFFMALLVEYPVSTVVQHFLNRKIQKNQNFDDNMEMKPRLAQIHN